MSGQGPRRTRVKICGVRDVETAIAAASAGADAIGLVFAAASPRCVTADAAAAIADALPPWVVAVGVFADAPIGAIVADWPGQWVQLHGHETTVPSELRNRHVMKALPIDADERAFERWDRDPAVTALLIDAPDPGQGRAFDHQAFAARRATLTKPLVIAGGLTPENVGRAIHILRPWAVDVSSGVERERGIKDPARIDAFCAAVRAADAS
ncbi:MAG: phosphoribosylanthranilate isomerase [Phycisphaerales bacterium]|nr:phosphoribosylanthranilate isomerase [Phycisphaerales bacterium]